MLPVVEVGAVGQVVAAELARLSDIGQAGDEVGLYGVVLAHLVELLPRLRAPVGADLLTHAPVEVTQRSKVKHYLRVSTKV